MNCAFLLLFSLTAWAADAPRIVYSKTFPGSIPPFISVSVSPDGTAVYNESEDPDNAESIRLDAGTSKQLFDLAERLDRFRHPLESGLKVANMGQKTLRWEDDAGKSEAKFNYSASEDAKALTDRFESIGESARLLVEFRRAMKYDRLGVDSVLLKTQLEWDTHRLLATAEFLPLLDQVAKNEAFIHMARERAAGLAEGIRAAAK